MCVEGASKVLRGVWNGTGEAFFGVSDPDPRESMSIQSIFKESLQSKFFGERAPQSVFINRVRVSTVPQSLFFLRAMNEDFTYVDGHTFIYK